jgi:hypothetical protein
VKIVSPTGSSSLGRDVVATGYTGKAKHRCYMTGWLVITSDKWTAYFIKTIVHPKARGMFRTPTLELGSPGETGSRWWPYLLAGSQRGCSWARRLLARIPTGEYHGAWPPPGITVLYQTHKPLRRTS